MSTELVVIGCSWGGLAACQSLLAALPCRPCPPIVVAQHRGASRSALADLIGRRCPWPVLEPDDDEVLRASTVFIAPPDYHLLVEPGHLKLSTDAPVNHSRPSIDVLFESAAVAYGCGVVGVVLTGANEDGARGLAAVAARGGTAVVQDPESADRQEMPRAALLAVPDALVMPIEGIGRFVASLCGQPVDAARPPGVATRSGGRL